MKSNKNIDAPAHRVINSMFLQGRIEVKRLELDRELKVYNIGLESFAEDLLVQGIKVQPFRWSPPGKGDERLVGFLKKRERYSKEIDRANQEALARIVSGSSSLIGIAPAGECIPELKNNMFLHSGPPVTWQKMCGPMKGAMIGAAIYEGLAADAASAVRLFAGGEIKFAPCHDFGAVGPMAGVISPGMALFIVKNETHGNIAYSNMNEGLGKVLRFGAYSPEVLHHLRWLQETLAPALKTVIEAMGGVNLTTIQSKAIQMGDECHNRNAAATMLFIKEILPQMVKCLSLTEISEIVGYLTKNDHFFLNLSMAACKCNLDAAADIEHSSIVTAMCRNGVEFGIRISGLGNRWIARPASRIEGLYFPGYGDEDACPDLGDSSITETYGLGGFAMAAAPAIVQFVGGAFQDALKHSREMGRITVGVNPAITMPSLEFAPIPTGIDVWRVIAKGILPVINTGIAHKEAGIGQIGAGIVKAPWECFAAAAEELARRLE